MSTEFKKIRNVPTRIWPVVPLSGTVPGSTGWQDVNTTFTFKVCVALLWLCVPDVFEERWSTPTL